MPLTPHTHLGPYEIISLIGAGGMGEVYKARDSRLARDVAVKVLPPEFAAQPDRMRRFEQEARAIAALNHPNVLAIYDVGSQDGTAYLNAQDFIPGQDTAKTRRALAGFDPDNAVESFGISPDGSGITVSNWELVYSLMMADRVPGVLPLRRVK